MVRSYRLCSKGLGVRVPGCTGTSEAVPKPASPCGGGRWLWTPGVLQGTRPLHPMVPGDEGSQGPGSPCRPEPRLVTGPAPNPQREAGPVGRASALPHFNWQQPADVTTSAGRFKDNKSGGTFQTGALPGQREGPRTTGGARPQVRGGSEAGGRGTGRHRLDSSLTRTWGWLGAGGHSERV